MTPLHSASQRHVEDGGVGMEGVEVEAVYRSQECREASTSYSNGSYSNTLNTGTPGAQARRAQREITNGLKIGTPGAQARRAQRELVVEISSPGGSSLRHKHSTASPTKRGVHSRSSSLSLGPVPSKRLFSQSRESSAGDEVGRASYQHGWSGGLAAAPLLSNGHRHRLQSHSIDVDSDSDQYASDSKRFKRKGRTHERVEPPVNTQRMPSLFHKAEDLPDLWSAPHRLPRDASTLACQWVTLDEGFGNVERCEQVFVTPEALASHVHQAHCLSTDGTVKREDDDYLTCAWGSCKFKRYPSVQLKEHVLQHLAPLAWACPFEYCRLSTNAANSSCDALDTHIQTYHLNGEELRPLGIPLPWREDPKLTQKLPELPESLSCWKLHHRNPRTFQRLAQASPTGLRNHPALVSPESLEDGDLQPFENFLIGLEELEPPAIPLASGMLGQDDDEYSQRMRSLEERFESPPTILIKEVPPARMLNAKEPQYNVEVYISPPKAGAPIIDMRDIDIDPEPLPLPLSSVPHTQLVALNNVDYMPPSDAILLRDTEAALLKDVETELLLGGDDEEDSLALLDVTNSASLPTPRRGPPKPLAASLRETEMDLDRLNLQGGHAATRPVL